MKQCLCSRFIYRYFSIVVTCASTLVVCADEGAIIYDIANSNRHQGTVPPIYDGGADGSALAYDLTPFGLHLSSFSAGDQDGPGKFWFAGWPTGAPNPGGPHFSLSMTALRPFTPMTLEYTAFSGFWSGLFSGPTRLNVFFSKDGFATFDQVSSHSIGFTHPGVDGENTFEDDLSGIGLIDVGEILELRLVLSDYHPNNLETPAGLSNIFSNDKNLVLTINHTVPEPSTYLTLVGLGVLVASKIRRQR